MAKIDVKCLRARHRQKCSAHHGKRNGGMCRQEVNGQVGVEGNKNVRMVENVHRAGNTQCNEPRCRKRPENRGDFARAKALNGEKPHQDEQRQRNHGLVEAGRNDLQALNRRKHGNCRGNQRIAVEQRGTDDAQAQHQRLVARCHRFACQRHDGEGSTLALVVCAKDKTDILHCNDQCQRPEDDRKDADHFHFRGRAVMRYRSQRFAKRIERAGADIAVNDSNGPERKSKNTPVVRSMVTGI